MLSFVDPLLNWHTCAAVIFKSSGFKGKSNHLFTLCWLHCNPQDTIKYRGDILDSVSRYTENKIIKT